MSSVPDPSEDHPNAKDRRHARADATDALPESVAGEYWSATAPIQADQFGEAGQVPLRVARLAWDAYEAAGHGEQDLATLNRRAGFSWGELILLLRGPPHYRGNHYGTCFKNCAKGKTT